MEVTCRYNKNSRLQDVHTSLILDPGDLTITIMAYTGIHNRDTLAMVQPSTCAHAGY